MKRGGHLQEIGTSQRSIRSRLSQAALDLEAAKRSRFMYTLVAFFAALILTWGIPEVALPAAPDAVIASMRAAAALYELGRIAVLLAPLISVGGRAVDADLPEQARKTARSITLGGSAAQAETLAASCELTARRDRRTTVLFMGVLFAGLMMTWAARIMALRAVMGV